MRWIYFHHKKYWIHTNTLHNICISIARLVKTKDKMILLHIYSNYDRLLENVYISLGTLNWIFVIHKIYSKISILFSILNIIRKYSNAFYLKGFSKKKLYDWSSNSLTSMDFSLLSTTRLTLSNQHWLFKIVMHDWAIFRNCRMM